MYYLWYEDTTLKQNINIAWQTKQLIGVTGEYGPYSAMVIKQLTDVLNVSKKDIIITLRERNKTLVDELRADGFTVRTGADYRDVKTLKNAFSCIKRLLLIGTPNVSWYSSEYLLSRTRQR